MRFIWMVYDFRMFLIMCVCFRDKCCIVITSVQSCAIYALRLQLLVDIQHGKRFRQIRPAAVVFAAQLRVHRQPILFGRDSEIGRHITSVFFFVFNKRSMVSTTLTQSFESLRSRIKRRLIGSMMAAVVSLSPSMVVDSSLSAIVDTMLGRCACS